MTKDQTNLLEETRRVLKRIGLPIISQNFTKGEWRLATGVIHFDNGPGEIITFSYKPEPDYILISDQLAYPVSKERAGDMLEIINELNTFQIGGTFYLDGKAAAISVSDGFYVNDPNLDEVTFEKTLQFVMKNGEKFLPMIKDFLSGKGNKRELFQEIERAKKEGLKNAKIKE